MQWFRLYHEVRAEPKLLDRTPSENWAWIVLLCLASESRERGHIFLSDNAISNATRLGDEWPSFRDFLTLNSMLRVNGDGFFEIINWGRRQPNSDDVAVRVAKHRAEKTCNVTVTLPKRNCNVQDQIITDQTRLDKTRTVVPSEDSKESSSVTLLTDFPKKSPKTNVPYTEDFNTFWEQYPPRSGDNPKQPAFKSFEKAIKEGIPASDIISGAVRYTEFCKITVEDRKMVCQAVTWLNQHRWENDYDVTKAMPNSKEDAKVIRSRERLRRLFHSEEEDAINVECR